MAEKQLKLKILYDDLQLSFKYVNLNYTLTTDQYSADEIKKIKDIIQLCTKEILIDKSYVDFPKTLYEKTILTYDSWKDLCKLILKTNFGKNATLKEHLILVQAYSLMIICYIYQIIFDFNIDCSGIQLEIKDKSKYMIEFYYNTNKEWKHYVGKWQTWKNNFTKNN